MFEVNSYSLPSIEPWHIQHNDKKVFHLIIDKIYYSIYIVKK